jgi:hypothetical protein
MPEIIQLSHFNEIPKYKFLLATYSPAQHAPSVALQTDSSSLVIEKLDVRYEILCLTVSLFYGTHNRLFQFFHMLILMENIAVA